MVAKKKNTSPKSITNIHIHGNVNDSNIAVGDDNKINNQRAKTKSKEILFDAGARLRQVREEIGLKSSEFVGLLGIQSEKQYRSMERQAEEAPLSLLEKAHDVTGASLEWLMHGNGQRYKVEESGFNPASEGLDFIAKLKPKKVYFVLGRSFIAINNLVAGVVVQTDKYRYQVIDYGMHLDFWNWSDQLGYVLLFYDFLSILWDRYHGPHGIVIPIRYSEQLYEGKIHFHEALKHANGRYLFWPNAILDVEYKHQSKAHYERYYGKWISRVHRNFIEINTAVKKREL